MILIYLETKSETNDIMKSRDHAAIGRGNIFRLWKVKGWNTVEFVESISLNSMTDHFFA